MAMKYKMPNFGPDKLLAFILVNIAIIKVSMSIPDSSAKGLKM